MESISFNGNSLYSRITASMPTSTSLDATDGVPGVPAPDHNLSTMLRLTCARDYDAHHAAALDDPGTYWGKLAACALHWHSAETGKGAGWLSQCDSQCSARSGPGGWQGWSADTAEPVHVAVNDCVWPDSGSLPWRKAVETEGRFVRWFMGGVTSAAFNEIDRHVLRGSGSDTAFVHEPDPKTGHPVTTMSYAQLLLFSTVAARAIRAELGIEAGQRIVIYMPNGPWPVVWVEAAKRLSSPFCGIAAGTAANALADRLMDTAAAMFVTGGGEDNLELGREALALCLDRVLEVVAVQSTVPGASAPVEGASGLRDGWQDADSLLSRVLLSATHERSSALAGGDGAPS